MQLQTQIPLVKESNNQIDYTSNILLLGSCFVENIGTKLEYFKFQNLQNPFGILFHPKAIETVISKAINKTKYTEDDIFFYNELWHCFDAHSKLNNASKNDLLIELNKQIELTNKQIRNSTHIIITLGTAWMYRFIETNKIVANCHKVPQAQFSKELMSITEVINSLKNSIRLIRSVNSKASIIFTVSPVRHIKDGFIENAQSKAHLIAAIHQIINCQLSINNCQLAYFPSYEIMMDELRDYRFYAEDMIHPNQIAIKYIWGKFKFVWISTDAYKTLDEVDTIQKGLLHKPFNPKAEGHQHFLKNLNERTMKLQLEYPHMVF